MIRTASLLVALGVTAILTYRAYVSSRRHQAVVERVLRDYVEVASYQLKQSTETAVYSCLRLWFNEVDVASPHLAVSRLHANDCGNQDDARFELDLRTGALRTSGAAISPALLQSLPRTIAQQPALQFRGPWQVSLLSIPTAGGRELFAYAVRSEKGEPRNAAGMKVTASGGWILHEVFNNLSLLPPTLTSGRSNADIFNARLTSGSAPAVRHSEYNAHVTLEPAFGGLGIDVELQPDALNRLVPGGVPENRGFELLGLLTLAVALVISSLLLLRREAELARERASFVSSVSHELRTPLAQIRMFAETLLHGRLRAEADRRRSLEIIDKEARRLTQLIENVLHVARSDRGQSRVNPTDTRIAPAVREAVDAFAVLAEANQVEFRLELEDEIRALVDTAALRQILLNLLDNAVKYGPVGQRVVIGLALFGSVARLWVDDEGPGVPVRERERVFEPFYRARKDSESHVAGSGIGLAVVRELAVLHGGAAWIEDAPTAGARVVIELPGAYVPAARSADDWAVA